MAGITDKTTEVAARGRPRSEKARRAILDAAGDLMLEGGIAAASMEAIAARAGVSKATIYKWWPSRGAVALEGFLEKTRETIAIPDNMNARESLTYLLTKLTALIRDKKLSPLMMGVISQGVNDAEIAKALRDQWLAPRRSVSKSILRAAMKSGEVRADIEADVALDQLFTPLYHRIIFGLEPYTPSQAKKLVDQLFEGIKPL